jgi:hypothetical protein
MMLGRVTKPTMSSNVTAASTIAVESFMPGMSPNITVCVTSAAGGSKAATNRVESR